MRKLALLALLIPLAACQTLEEQRAEINAIDDARCRELGARRGSPVYVQCRTDLDRNRAIASQPRTVIVSRPGYYGSGPYFGPRPYLGPRPYYGPRRVFY